MGPLADRLEALARDLDCGVELAADDAHRARLKAAWIAVMLGHDALTGTVSFEAIDRARVDVYTT